MTRKGSRNRAIPYSTGDPVLDANFESLSNWDVKAVGLETSEPGHQGVSITPEGIKITDAAGQVITTIQPAGKYGAEYAGDEVDQPRVFFDTTFEGAGNIGLEFRSKGAFMGGWFMESNTKDFVLWDEAQARLRLKTSTGDLWFGPGAQSLVRGSRLGADGSLWVTDTSVFHPEQGGVLELGGKGSPYVDFRRTATQDFDVRVQNDANGILTVFGSLRRATAGGYIFSNDADPEVRFARGGAVLPIPASANIELEVAVGGPNFKSRGSLRGFGSVEPHLSFTGFSVVTGVYAKSVSSAAIRVQNGSTQQNATVNVGLIGT